MLIKSMFASVRPGPETRPRDLILLTVLVLTPFFYFLRADTIGVTSATRSGVHGFTRNE